MPQQLETTIELPEFENVLQEAEQILKECFKQFQLEEVFLSFNGGKDCTALLDITINVLRKLHKRDNIAKELKVVYIRTNGPFREIESFVKDIEAHYGIKLKVIDGDLKETLEQLLEQDGRLRACLMGTRRTDPYSSDLKHMQSTDANWPAMTRVFPLLNWSYHQIWSYLLRRRVPYCCLYDKGYTSIGSIQNTRPNPALAYKDTGDRLSYHPAWRLAEGSQERAGRGTAPLQPANGHACPADKCNGQLNGDDVRDC